MIMSKNKNFHYTFPLKSDTIYRTMLVVLSKTKMQFSSFNNCVSEQYFSVLSKTIFTKNVYDLNWTSCHMLGKELKGGCILDKLF